MVLISRVSGASRAGKLSAVTISKLYVIIVLSVVLKR